MIYYILYYILDRNYHWRDIDFKYEIGSPRHDNPIINAFVVAM